MADETSREIDQAAAQWAARIDRAPLSSAEEATLEIWLAGDPRRLGAFAKARAVALHSQRAAALAGGGLDIAARDRELQVERRALLAASAAVAMVSGAGLMAALIRKSQSFQTRKGEVRTVQLDDGSSITLNTASRASVRYGRETREIVLTYGEALFSVVEGQRPFIVRTAGSVITAAAGRFVVRRLEQAPLQIMALDAAVSLRPMLGSALQIRPQKFAALEDNGVELAPLDAAGIERALAWRDMKLVLHNDTLAQAVAEFARYSDVKIELTQPWVGDLRITGLFKVDEPSVFARAVAVSLNLHVIIGANLIRLGP